MNWLLPTFVRIKFPRFPALWLPIFLLLWPCALLVFSLGLLFTLFIAGTGPASGRACSDDYRSRALRGRSTPRARALQALSTAWHLLCALRGTEVDVQQPYARYHFSLY